MHCEKKNRGYKFALRFHYQLPARQNDDKGDSYIFHDELFVSVYRADFYIRMEIAKLLIVLMEDMHEVSVGVCVIFAENKPVVVELVEIDGMSGKEGAAANRRRPSPSRIAASLS